MSDPVQLREILEEVIDLSLDERDRRVDELCQGDASLRSEVLRVLAHDSADDDFLDATPDSLAEKLRPLEEELAAGTRLGPWVVYEPIASGGMGTVHRGARADESFEKVVAIKVIKAGMDSAEVLARFENERRVLAELEHPGIARLLDAGLTARNRPFLVMEYVAGKPLDEYASEQGLRVERRVELLAEVCDAVHAAHQALVVHRDLKPSNVLVTDDGTPKLLDFGIAKVLDPRSQEHAAHTLGPSRVLTPEYASPEQLRGEFVSTGSDVYSLGVLLYELLAGTRPQARGETLGTENRPFSAARSTRRPSTVVVAAWAHGLGETARSLRRRLAGDLDVIALKALHEEPDRRYASAAQLADDLRRHLAGLPVEARPDRWTYRASKFVRRHRLTVAAAAVAVVALIGGVIVSWVQASRATTASRLADQRFEEGRELALSFLFELDTLLQDSEGSMPARDFVVSRGLAYLDALAEQRTGDVELGREVIRGYLKMGDIQGGPLGSNLGRREAARASYERALELAGELGAEQAGDLAMFCHHRLGALAQDAGALREAHASYSSALELRGAMPDPPLGGTLLQALLDVQDSLVTHAERAGEFDEALVRADELVRMINEHASEIPSRALPQLRVISMTRRGIAQGLAGMNHQAERSLRSAVALGRAWTRDEPSSAAAESGLTFALFNLATELQTRGVPDEALALLEECLPIHRRQRTNDPSNVQATRDLIACLNLLSYILPAEGQDTGALEAASEFLDVANDLLILDPADPVARRNLGIALLAIARANSKLGDHSDAHDACAQAREVLQELATELPDDVETQRDLAGSAEELGLIFDRWANATDDRELRKSRKREALSALQEQLAILERLHEQGRLAASDERWIERGKEQVRAAKEALAVR